MDFQEALNLCETAPFNSSNILHVHLVFQENSYLFRTSLYLAASASAEFFADIALAPMEAVKVRIQTQPGWANTLREGAPKLWAEEGVRGYVDLCVLPKQLAPKIATKCTIFTNRF